MSGVPDDALPEEGHGFDYDLVVIGGGSGGLACSKEAAKLGKKVACLDFVKPTPMGTQWGLGGTCVNVGCIPKKLMHTAALLGESFSDAKAYGWKVQAEGHDWTAMVTSVQDYIHSLNFGYRVALRDASVMYLNKYAKFKDPHTLECVDRKGKVSLLSSRRFVVAVGGRPRYLGIPGDKELCITSDDVFSLPSPPGRTLCIGASYISMETAGFLAGTGCDVSIMARSIFLRGFDQEIAEHLAAYMGRHGVRIIRPAVPTKFERHADGKRVVVTYRRTQGASSENQEEEEEVQEVFDTVVVAVGRDACTEDLGLDLAGVTVDPQSGKIRAEGEQSNVPHIYAIGDVLHGRPELTPVAIQAGTLLARRLYKGAALHMDYDLIPTTVFTPLEYGCIGLAEEEAVEKLGQENVEVYHSYFKPLEWAINHDGEGEGKPHREDNQCYAKLIANKADNERIVGFHVVAPNAGEITQGYAVAMRMGATKSDFDATVGIHPTISEEFTILRVRKGSGESPLKTGC